MSEITAAERNALEYVATGQSDATPKGRTLNKLLDRDWITSAGRAFGGTDYVLTPEGERVVRADPKLRDALERAGG